MIYEEIRSVEWWLMRERTSTTLLRKRQLIVSFQRKNNIIKTRNI